MSLRAIFFDAGGTIVLADHDRTLEPLNARGIRPTGAELAAAEKAAKSMLDSQVLQPGQISVEKTAIGITTTPLCCTTWEWRMPSSKSDLILRTRTSSNWSRLAAEAEATRASWAANTVSASSVTRMATLATCCASLAFSTCSLCRRLRHCRP